MSFPEDATEDEIKDQVVSFPCLYALQWSA